jgi:hypothetical protein
MLIFYIIIFFIEQRIFLSEGQSKQRGKMHEGRFFNLASLASQMIDRKSIT